jgi:trehalose/maltose hydrolase-like predicted phosphorylase
MWLKELQLALIEEDPKRISVLMERMPKFESVEDMKSAAVLIKQALVLMHTLKDETSYQMKQIQKNLDFLSSTQAPAKYNLDIKS